MASRLILGYQDKVGSAISITSAAANPAYPASNLASGQPGEILRTSTGTTSASVLIDFGAQVAIGAVFLGATNLTSAATWRIRFATSDATGVTADAYTSASLNAGVSTQWGKALRVLPASATGRYLLVDLVDASLPYLQAGILRAMVAWNPLRAYKFGAKYLKRDWSKVKPGPNGQQWPLLGTVQRGIEFEMPAVGSAEWIASGDIMAQHSGVSRDVLVCLDSAATDLGRVTYFGLLEQVPEYQQVSNPILSTTMRLFDRC